MMSEFMSPSRLCQIEIYVSDIGKSLRYFKEVFGWEKVPAYIHNLCVLDVGDAEFGISLVPLKLKAAQKLTLYFKIDSIDQIKKMKKASEKISQKEIPDEKNLPSYGRVHFIVDPDGHRFGLFCPE